MTLKEEFQRRAGILPTKQLIQENTISPRTGNSALNRNALYRQLVILQTKRNEVGLTKPEYNFLSLITEALNEKNWISGAVNPAHKGYCSPMSKDTCTPRRKALAQKFKHSLEEVTPPLPKHIINKVEAEYGKHNPKTYRTLWAIYNKAIKARRVDSVTEDMSPEERTKAESERAQRQGKAKDYIAKQLFRSKTKQAELDRLAATQPNKNKDMEPRKIDETDVPCGHFWDFDPINVQPQDHAPLKKYSLQDLDPNQIVAVAPPNSKSDVPVVVPANRIRMGVNDEGARSYRVSPQDDPQNWYANTNQDINVNDDEKPLEEAERSQMTVQDLNDQNHYADSGNYSPNKNSAYNAGEEEESIEEALANLAKEAGMIDEESTSDGAGPYSPGNWVSKSKRGSEAGIAGSESLGMTTVKEIRAAVMEAKRVRKLKEQNEEPVTVDVSVEPQNIQMDQGELEDVLAKIETLTPDQLQAFIDDILSAQPEVDESSLGRRYTKHPKKPTSSKMVE